MSKFFSPTRSVINDSRIPFHWNTAKHATAIPSLPDRVSSTRNRAFPSKIEEQSNSRTVAIRFERKRDLSDGNATQLDRARTRWNAEDNASAEGDPSWPPPEKHFETWRCNDGESTSASAIPLRHEETFPLHLGEFSCYSGATFDSVPPSLRKNIILLSNVHGILNRLSFQRLVSRICGSE